MIFEIPARMPVGQEELSLWDGFLTDAEINFILAQPEWVQTEAARIGNAGGEPVAAPHIRETRVGWIGPRPEMHAIWDKFAKVFAEVNRRHFHYDLTGFHEPMQLGVYSATANGHYNWHTDACAQDSGVPRKLSMALLLSDTSEFEGGAFQVKTTSDEPRTLETKRGRAWFFPAHTLHRVAPVTQGVRRSLVLWAGGPAFK
jgi:PKHD-type hydroxylase